MGCEVVKTYRDHDISGAKGRDKRPQFDQPCRDAIKREFDTILAWSVDRLGRSLSDLIEFLTEIHALKIDLYLHQQGLDTTTPAGRMIFTVLGAVAELERSLIVERVKAGLRNAKAKGKRLGRPRVVVDASRVASLRDSGRSWPQIARLMGCGVATAFRAYQGLSKNPLPNELSRIGQDAGQAAD